jgi:hypothetical protein
MPVVWWGVRGRFAITASTGYDVVLYAYRTTRPRGQKSFSEADLVTITCNDAAVGTGNELNMVISSASVNPNEAIVIQTASSCGVGDPSKCTGGEVGGATTLSVRFTPDDFDGDGFPDTIDACFDTVGEAPNGCPPPDQDGDGIPDRSDSCLTQYGVPPTGCPADVDRDGTANENESPGCLFLFGTNPGGCPDPDNDQVHNTADKCWNVAGIQPDGCPDSDKDTVSDRIDKCRTVRGKPNSDGCPKPVVAAIQTSSSRRSNGTQISSMVVKAARGAKVEFRCTGRGCKKKLKRFTVKRGVHSLLPYLPKNRFLRAGIKIEVRVTAPLTLGQYVRYRVLGRNRKLERRDQCIRANGKLARTCK